jgi:hypothetical protein
VRAFVTARYGHRTWTFVSFSSASCAPFVRVIESTARIAVSVASAYPDREPIDRSVASCRSCHQLSKLLRLRRFQSHFDPFRLPRIGRRRVVGEADSVRSVESEFDGRP